MSTSMDTARRLSTLREKKKICENGKISKKSVEKKKREGHLKEGCMPKEKFSKTSMIPVPKCEKTEVLAKDKSAHQKQKKSYSSSKLCGGHTLTDKAKEDLEAKLKLIEDKEKSVEQYYLKIENLIKKLQRTDKKEKEKPAQIQPVENAPARKITSEPVVFSQNNLKDDIFTDLENSFHQISEIWLKTSTDLSYTLNNLKKNPTLTPKQFELEKIKIQLAIKQTKSLTLVKTRNIIAEAKKLFRNREMIRSELESLLNYNSVNLECGKCKCIKGEMQKNFKEKGTNTNLESSEKKTLENPKVPIGNGDTSKESDLESESTITSNICEGEILKTGAEDETKTLCQLSSGATSSEEKVQNSENSKKWEKHNLNKTLSENYSKEMTKKKETITSLNNKIFELQKICNDHSFQYNQLQIELAQFREKIQWNQLLWKQIGKLKDQIKSLQQSNKLLECQKRELECKLTKLNREMERLLKLNQRLNQKKLLLQTQENTLDRECKPEEKAYKVSVMQCEEDSDMEICIDERILVEKQNAVNQLRKILDVMKEQENFAHKQIFMFQNKIQELEKNTKA